MFPDAISSLNYDFWEVDAGLGYNFDAFYSEVSLKYSPEHFANSGNLRYVKLEGHLPVHEKLKLKSHIAHRHIQDNVAFSNIPDSFDWEVGVEFKPVSNVDLIFKYVDSSLSKKECLNTDLCSERVIAGISYHF